MKKYNCDFHIHIGSACKKAVKVTASRNMTILNIIEHSIVAKGMDIIGLVDCGSPYVLQELSFLIREGILEELEEGGLVYKSDLASLTLILGSEVETQEGVHAVCFFPDLSRTIAFSEFLATKVTNNNLSTQRANVTSNQLLDFVKEHDGIFMPAHIFTPHKSYYGKAFTRLKECFGNRVEEIDVVELGLSADTKLADCIAELHNFNFLTNSDAHSVGKIAREYNVLQLEAPTFSEIKKGIKNRDGRKIIANYGLDPQLGKYYYNFCANCDKVLEDCFCDKQKIVKGVYNRIMEIKDLNFGHHPIHRPQYYYQIPLEFIPGLGKKGREKALQELGTEAQILHQISEEKLRKYFSDKIVEIIIKGREGSLSLQRGGGGKYGKVMV
ncbi:endonuclease Q family protein [Anaerobranca gottschalkii]|uniref:TIGR00375 family protein n=1 Tax=Anaerobranca gottschalkii DSM 13577 TaxID=1120990 RepID=A0A1H9Y1D3_9FIRM|nr:endonuclease Q family protein [Anaerobranca gottschalkii]SES62509.1 TIGR00375 family protein [Anaerobranca gottschalkii DSM 13577]